MLQRFDPGLLLKAFGCFLVKLGTIFQDVRNSPKLLGPKIIDPKNG